MKSKLKPSHLILVLPPLVGCLALARIGANRPEQLILGKWRVHGFQAAETTIEFRPDGTYQSLNKLQPESNAPERSKSARARLIRSRGRYSLSDRRHLSLEPLGAQEDGKPPSLRSGDLAERGSVSGNEVEIDEGRVQVFVSGGFSKVAQVWTRME